ncbi:MAG: polyphosphate kinase 1 [Melioribacteraceae bacterium]
MQVYKYKNRDLSWLSFNYRVLQEAKDPRVPLYERIKFLAIYSSNLDEFFRVRVAGLKSLQTINKKTQKALSFDPTIILKKIFKIVNKQQNEFGEIFRKQILPELKENKIFLIDETEVTDYQKEFIADYFNESVIPQVQPILLIKKKIIPFLRNRRPYLAVKLKPKNTKPTSSVKKRVQHKYAIIEIPSNHLPRFISLPSNDSNKYIIFLDDIIRIHLSSIFQGYEIVSSYSIKLTRDAELYIEDEFSGDLLDKISKSLKKRNTGKPSRFLYDEKIPTAFLKVLKESFLVGHNDLAQGSKYHNFNDFFAFPNPNRDDLKNEPLPPLKQNELESFPTLFEAMSQKDFALNFPYQTYDYVIDFFRLAATDPNVTSIYLTQYRVAKHSQIIKYLERAVKNKKKVMVFVELKARFDEESNILWAEEMKQRGINVLYSFPGLKVHSKLALVIRKENKQEKSYCYLGTGNFHEQTAQLYCDLGLFTTDKRITKEVKTVFDFLEGQIVNPKFRHLLVAQFNMRNTFTKLIDKEIDATKKGKKAEIILKMNSLEDRKMINKLYEASNAGVKIKIIVRGICCLVPGVARQSENISVISIVDRFLEHSRIFIFYNGGHKKVYAGSADWMRRNLSKRIEVIFPIYNEKIKKEILDIIFIQLKDNVKARHIDRYDKNNYVKIKNQKTEIQSQVVTYNYLKDKHCPLDE